MSTSPNLLDGANERSSEIRSARAVVRRGLRAGTLTLEDVLADPTVISTLSLFELITWRRGWGKDNQRMIGALALRDQINLAVHAGGAPRRTIDWLIHVDETMCANRRVMAA